MIGSFLGQFAWCDDVFAFALECLVGTWEWVGKIILDQFLSKYMLELMGFDGKH